VWELLEARAERVCLATACQSSSLVYAGPCPGRSGPYDLELGPVSVLRVYRNVPDVGPARQSFPPFRA